MADYYTNRALGKYNAACCTKLVSTALWALLHVVEYVAHKPLLISESDAIRHFPFLIRTIFSPLPFFIRVVYTRCLSQ